MKYLAMLLIAGAIIGCNANTSRPASRPAAPSKAFKVTAFEVTDIKGDVLGMSLDEYRHKHPKDCDSKHDCFGSSTTYASLTATKMVFFAGDRLYSVSYLLTFDDSLLSDENKLLSEEKKLKALLVEKYGEPGRSTSTLMTWDNGKVKITYLRISNLGNLTFTLNELIDKAKIEMDEQKKWMDEQEKQKALARQRDM